MAAYLVLLLVTYFAVYHVGYCLGAKILGPTASTRGYLKSGTERTEHVGVTVHMDKYTKKNQECLMVMRMEQTVPWKRVDEIMVNCEPASWTVKDTVLSYGSIVHIHTRHNRVAWALLDMKQKCIQRIYTVRGTEEDLARMEAVLTRVECDRVLRTQQHLNKPTKAAKAGKQYDVDTGVLAMNGEVDGYKLMGSNTVSSGATRVEVSYYHKQDTVCARVVVIYIHDLEVQKIKVSCGPSNGREANGNFQFGKAFTVRPEPGNNVFNILYHVPNQYCIRKTYTAVKGDSSQPTKVTKITESVDERTNDKECQGLKAGRDVLSPNRFVIAMNGNMRGYRKGESKVIDNKGNVQLESQVFYESDGSCVTLGVISIQDTEVQRMKMNCGEMNGRRVGQHYQLGSVFMIRAETGTGIYHAIFNFQNDHCYSRTYTVDESDPKIITRSKRTRNYGQECTDLMGGTDLISAIVDTQPAGES